nr:DNA helicase [Tanacetum cinerariifolium]
MAPRMATDMEFFMIMSDIRRGDSDGSDCCGRLILPQSFIGGPRYMYAHYLDALAICRVHGNPSYFITFTCNVKWPEIAEYMDDFRGMTTADRVDIVDRLNIFYCSSLHGRIPKTWSPSLSYSNMGRRRLTHQHPEDIDNYVSAELSSKEIDPEGHRVVGEFMLHGPCGE